MSNRLFYTVVLACLLVYVIGMWQIPLIDIDAAQYASMSREMMETGSYLKLYDLGYDYLDKPPMLFWLSSISLGFFGVHDWAYRLPSVLMLLLGIYATYQLAKLYYSKLIAQLAVWVLASSQAVFLMVHDVRCDTMLMGWVTLSIWQLAKWYETQKWKNLLVAFAAIAGGMMTKGPIALMVPVFAFVPHFVLRREWKQFVRWQYLPGLLLVAVLLVPMSIGLYQQFDLEPGKIFHGVPIQSGLRFYYWTQSFGRYTGENVFHEMSHFTFLLENMLWSFLPWIICFLIALGFSIKLLIQNKGRIGNTAEWISTGGFVVTYCVLARSQAQLPHYIFVVLPLASIVTAVWLQRFCFTDILKGWRRPLLVAHALLFSLLWVALVVLMFLPFKTIPIWVGIASILSALGFFVLLIRADKRLPLFLQLSLYTVIGVNFFLNSAFYPSLLQYQMGNKAAAFINQQQLPKDSVVLYEIDESRALHFYGKHIFKRVTDRNQLTPGLVLITRKSTLPNLQSKFPVMRTIFEGTYFGVSMLTLPFLNPKTRSQEVTPYVLVDLNGKKD